MPVCNFTVGMKQKDFLRYIHDDMSLEREKLSVIFTICSPKIKGSKFKTVSTNVMVAYFSEDTLTELKLDYLWPTDTSFVESTPIVKRF